eukprot:429001-Pleurochrysis_carterae.AAC.1
MSTFAVRLHLVAGIVPYGHPSHFVSVGGPNCETALDLITVAQGSLVSSAALCPPIGARNCVAARRHPTVSLYVFPKRAIGGAARSLSVERSLLCVSQVRVWDFVSSSAAIDVLQVCSACAARRGTRHGDGEFR